MSVPLYSRMSVTSKAEIRYEGILIEINAAAATITLAQVSKHEESYCPRKKDSNGFDRFI
jgi:hypothetical protein